MSTLIVPCANNKIIEGEPLCIKFHPSGRLFIEQAMQGLDLNEFDKIIIAISKEENEKYNIKHKIEYNFNDVEKLEIFIVEHSTEGPADTVYDVINEKKIEGELVVKDSTSYVEVSPHCYHKNFIVGLNVSSWKEDINDLRRKSFIQINEQSQILDIIEKKLISDKISVGVYGFKDCNEYIRAYRRLKDDNYPIKSLYVSHIISYLIGFYGDVFHYFSTDLYEDWSSEKSWMDVQRKMANYFIDLDAIFGLDFNGINNEIVINNLKTLSNQGARFIGFTSSDESIKKKMKVVFANNNINCIQVVYGCSMSKVKQIIDCKDMLKEALYII